MRTTSRTKTSALLRTLAAATMLAVTHASAATGDWTQYGFTAQGRRENTHETILTKTTVANLTWKWSANIQVGSSSAAVANGIVYVGSSDGHLYAFDARTGAPVWQAATGGPILSSPAVANGLVYVGSNDGWIYAFDAETGAVRWATYTGYGLVRSPVTMAGGILYAGTDFGDVFAINARTGVVKWTTTIVRTPGVISAPAVAHGIAYFAQAGFALNAFDARSGAPLWARLVGSSDFMGAPAVEDGVAFVNSDGGMGAFDAKTGATRWWDYISLGNSVAVSSSHIYMGTQYYALLRKVDSATGALEYEISVGHAMEAAPALANGVLYIGSEASTISAYDAARGTRLWQALTPGPVLAAATVSNGMLYVGSSNRFIAYGLP
jgi:outer membrane protein assembly factor BamB